MAQAFCVFLGEEQAIDALAEMNSAIKTFGYCLGMKVAPYTSELHLALCKEYGGNPPGDYLEGSDNLVKLLASLVSKASLKGKIAFISEVHFGGWRESESILWEKGKIKFGPSLEYEDQIKVLEMLPIDKEHLYGFTKYDHPDEWLQDSNC